MTKHIFTLLYLIAIFLFFYSEKLQKNIKDKKDVTKTKLLINGFLTFAFALLVREFFLLPAAYRRSSIFFTLSLIGILGLLCMISELLKLRYRLSKTPNDFMGNYYILRHIDYLNKNDAIAANEAILNACLLNPQNPNVWILRANFADYDLRSHEEAKKYLDTASNLIDQMSRLDKKVISNFQHTVGCLLLSENKFSEALIHLKKSYDLIPSDEKMNLIKKVKNEIEQI